MSNATITLNNFYIFLIELGFSLVFLTLFVSAHYGIVKNTKLGEKIDNSKKIKFIYFFLFGFLLSSLTFVVSYVSSLSINVVVVPLTIIGLIFAMTIFYSRAVQIGSLIPSIAWVMFEFGGFTSFNFDCIYGIVAILILAITCIVMTFIKIKQIYKILIGCAISFVCLFTLLALVVGWQNNYYYILIVLFVLSTIVYYSVIRFINKTLSHVSKLANQAAYIDNYYLAPAHINEYFNDFKIKNNISQALVITFDFNKAYSKQILDLIPKAFKKYKHLLFKSKYETYGLILAGGDFYINNLNRSLIANRSKSRSETDNLFELEKIINSFIKPEYKFKAFVSIYGIQSCKIDELLENSNYLYVHQNKVNSNCIQLFDPNIRNQDIEEKIAFTRLQQKINIDDITVKFEIIRFNSSKKEAIYPRFYWAKQLTCNIDDIVSKFDISNGDALIRALDIKAMKEYFKETDYSKYDLILPYPISTLNNQTWQLSSLIEKIEMFSIDSNKIILMFNTNKLKAIPKQVIENFRLLEKTNIKYIFYNVSKNLHLHNLKPMEIIH